MSFTVNLPLNILIVEDDEEWAKYICEILPDNIALDQVNRLDEVELYLKRKKYDLILVDLLLSEAELSSDVLMDFRNLIFIMSITNPHVRQWPPLIIMTIHEVHSQMPRILNRYGGWIWGWHEKDRFDVDDFHANVKAALETKGALEASLKMPDEWNLKDFVHVLLHLSIQGWAAIITVFGVLTGVVCLIGRLAR